MVGGGQARDDVNEWQIRKEGVGVSGCVRGSTSEREARKGRDAGKREKSRRHARKMEKREGRLNGRIRESPVPIIPFHDDERPLHSSKL